MTQTTSALVGSTGFVGTTLRAQRPFTAEFHSTNIADARDRTFDVVYCCACPAAKWKANQDPDSDLRNILQLCDVLSTVRTSLFVLVSTVDVYETPAGADESTPASQSATHHPYGRHRALFEEFVQKTFPAKHLIVRLPSLFGTHLRKNYVYDLLHGNQLDKVLVRSEFQWYDMRHLSRHIEVALANGLKTVNLVTQPVPTSRLFGIFGVSETEGNCTDAGSRYDVRTRHARIFASDEASTLGYIQSDWTVQKGLEDFLLREQLRPRITLSNIAFNDHSEAVKFLQVQGVSQIEVAPTKVFPGMPWTDLYEKVSEQKVTCPLRIGSWQSLFFGLPDMQLFGDRTVDAWITHAKRCIDMATYHTRERPVVLVLGAPKNRLVSGKSKDVCDAWAIHAFVYLARHAEGAGVVLCLEPNPVAYGCEWCTTAAEAAAIVRAVDHPGFRLHLDAACMFLAGDDPEVAIAANVDILAHFHISSPHLRPLYDEVYHRKVGQALKGVSYQGLLSIEMKADHHESNNDRTAREALEFVYKCYA